MSRCTLRNIFTVLIYAGVALSLYPYLTGRLSSGILLLVAGIGLAVLCGILRAACVEGDCPDREARALESKSADPQSTHPHAPSHP